MVDLPTVDSAKLANGVANLARQQVANTTQSALGTLTTISEGAESFGIGGLSGFVQMIKDWATKLLTSFGINLSTPAAETPAPAATPPAPAAGHSDTSVTPGRTPAAPKLPNTPAR